MARPLRTGFLITVSSLILLTACDGAGPFAGVASRADTSEAPAAGGETAGTVVEKDVEAPDVFAVNESGLWDGRPSLGGVWVAHPEVADPERVIIRNEANGKFVIGALFRRERDNPGPRIQVSSDAAAELGLLAGQPSVLDVIALRRETVEVPVDVTPENAAVPENEMALSDEVVGAEATEPADLELAALNEETSPEPKKERKGFLAGLFGKKRPAAETPAAPPQPLSGTEIETASLDPVSAASAAIDAAEAATPAAVASVASASAAEPDAPAKSLQQPYIQIGIFSVEENAENTATSLRGAGLLPTIREQEARGKKFWRVMVGPSPSVDERRAVLAKVRGLGFADAYYVSN